MKNVPQKKRHWLPLSRSTRCLPLSSHLFSLLFSSLYFEVVPYSYPLPTSLTLISRPSTFAELQQDQGFVLHCWYTAGPRCCSEQPRTKAAVLEPQSIQIRYPFFSLSYSLFSLFFLPPHGQKKSKINHSDQPTAIQAGGLFPSQLMPFLQSRQMDQCFSLGMNRSNTTQYFVKNGIQSKLTITITSAEALCIDVWRHCFSKQSRVFSY